MDAQQSTNDASTEASNGIGLTYDQMTQYLTNSITMEQTTPIDGQSHYTGKTDDSLALLEVIGDKSNISQATLIIGLPDDSQSVILRNSAMTLRFVKNIDPNWDGAVDWATDALKEAAASPGEKVYINRGDKRIEMIFEKSIAMLMITVKHS